MSDQHSSGASAAGPGDLPLPPRLRRTLERFRERLWSVKIAEGALAGLLGLALAYLLVFALDRAFDTPAWLRTSLLVAGFAVSGLGLPLLWHRWVWRQRTLADAARYLKRRHPRLGDELLGIVELAHRHSDGESLVLVEAAMRQVDEQVGERDFADAVPTRRRRRRLAAALACLGAAGLLLALVPEAGRNALARWLSPWNGPERYTFAQVEYLPETLVVPYAEPFPLAARLSESSEWRPSRARLVLPGRTRLESERREGRYDFAIPPQKDAGRLALRVGDSRETIAVEPLPRPELTALEAVVRLPDYLRYERDPVVPIRGASLQVVEGASAAIRGTTSRELAEARLDGKPAPVEGATFLAPPIAPESPTTATFSWRDVHGLEAKEPLELRLASVADRAPDIRAHQVGSQRIVLADEVVPFDIQADDDYGLREVGLEWTAETTERAEGGAIRDGEKPVAAGDPEKTSVQTRATFSARREGLPPGTYRVRAFANDFLPNRPRVHSPAFVLHVLGPEEHARWLTEEFSKWFRNARETYERERQLHESNLALRELSAEELDRPENRRRLQDQSSAESANARRLDALVSAGRGLVGEASKNPEFEAEKLERWAEMMRSLDQIARERMPSVADLLQRSSRAPGSPAGESGESGESGKSDAEANGSSVAEAPPSPPGLGDREKGLVPEEKAKGPNQSGGAPTGSGLPATTLSDPGGKEGDAPGPPPSSPAQQGLDRALEEQRELLAEFARVADELAEILASLEASTFVKRLKAASRKQTELADAVAKTLGEGFGLPRRRLAQQLREVGEEVARTQEEQSRFVHHIQTDLEAYYQRKQESLYKKVLDQMKDRSVVPALRLVGQESLANLSGRSVAATQFWADTLDRWAEELVAAAEGGQQGGQQQGESKSLPPEIVLRVMKSLRDEMRLRDETRELEEARAAFAQADYAEKVKPLEYSQTEIRENLDGAVEDILALPDAGDFGREVQLLAQASDIMRQAHAVLARPDTGTEAIAFQTEVIELLLQSKRQQSGGGGGGGGSSGQGGGNQGGGQGSALSDVGPQGGGLEPAPIPREVEQGTGKAGRELPEEFRRGLDHYFNAIETNRP